VIEIEAVVAVQVEVGTAGNYSNRRESYFALMR
jgi:hypothetical protein